MRSRFRELERELDNFKRRLRLQGIQNLDNMHSRIRINSSQVSRKTTPLTSRENSPYRTYSPKNGTRASSCPTFGSLTRSKASIKEELTLPIYKDYLPRTPTSLPASARFRELSEYGSLGSIKRGECHAKYSPNGFGCTHGPILEQKRRISKTGKHGASPQSSESPSSFARKLSSNRKPNQRDTNSTSVTSFCTPGESQFIFGVQDQTDSPQTNSPRMVLQQVKAKLAEYARLQG
ncbi:hypothetical protein KP509_1Z050600 [Ceratopteris richardii]|nr:hypothetical protein KP509_1Z050600 [Ceratopteris richardii]